MGCLSKTLGIFLVLYGLFLALMVSAFGSMIGPGFEGVAWWREFLGNTWDDFGFCLLMIAGGVGLIVLPGWHARWLKRRREIQYPKPGPVDDLA